MRLIGSHLYFSWSCHGTFSTSPRFSNAKPSARKLLGHLLVNQGTRANSKWPSRSITLTFSFPFVISGKENNCMYNIFHSRAVRGPVHTVLTSQPVKQNLKKCSQQQPYCHNSANRAKVDYNSSQVDEEQCDKKNGENQSKTGSSQGFFLLWKGCLFPYLFFNHLLNYCLFYTFVHFFSCSFPKGRIFGNCLSCPKHILAP